jgi:guanylate kinase
MSQESLPYRRGLMLVLSSPSGAGKTTLCRKLLAVDMNLTLSISMTTRNRRPGEVSGKDYIFVSEEEFDKSLANQELLEYAKVFDHSYGTPKKAVQDALQQGRDVLFDIDWQGTQQLSQLARSDLVSIFILPPSWDALESRLIHRAQDSQETVDKRMANANSEMSHWAEYDYVIINHSLEEALADIYAILKAERLKRQRQLGLGDFVRQLQGHV